jgi:FkbM family methyltransferase
MKISKRIERIIKWICFAPKIFCRYGTLSPMRVQLFDCNHWIHIDPQDRRAIKKFVYDPSRGRISPPRIFWRDFLEKLTPSVAVDIGVNYGECLFGARYNKSTQIFGFEANPRLIPYLKKSRNKHPEGDNITIIEGLVSDKAADEVSFYSNPAWSGTGSAVPTLNLGEGVVISEIQAHTLDSKIPRDKVTGKVLLFKMDIEGYEPLAFAGFQQTIQAASMVIGLVEFDTSYIREAGQDAETYFSKLEDIFEIYRFADGKIRSLERVSAFKSLPISRAEDKRIHTDLLLTKRGSSLKEWLPENWTIKSS